MSADASAASGLLGMVLSVQANYYHVQLEVNPSRPSQPPLKLLCTRRSRLKKLGRQVMVGDRVVVEEPDWLGQRGAIAEILPRQIQLNRPPVANANQLLLVFALAEPALEVYQLSRFLVKAEATGLTVVLCLSKCDLVTIEQQKYWYERLQAWGYAPILISLHTGEGLIPLGAQLRHNL
ncbi:MAG TPA: GTPase RsgA, partial [Candidatus Caenarcaniphilales bacterium]